MTSVSDRPTTEMSSLGAYLEFLTSGSRGWAQYYRVEGKPFLRIQNVVNGAIDLKDIQYVEPPDNQEANRTRAISGDVLISITADLGRAAVVPRELQGAHINQHLALLRLRSGLLPGFLVRFLQSEHGVQQFSRLNRHGVKAGLNFDDIRSLRIPVPPLEEQCRIAGILDQADILREKRRQALALVEQLPQSVFVEMFGGAHLERVQLGTLLVFLTSGSRGWARHYRQNGSPFLRIQNVKEGYLDLRDLTHVDAPSSAEAERTRVRAGDVLLSITADLGRAAVIPKSLEGAYINQHLALMRLHHVLVPAYLVGCLSSEIGQKQFQKLNKGGVKAGLNFDDVRSVEVPLPPLSLQQEFARRIEAVERLKAAHRRSLEEMDALFASLQHRAFRGEL